VAYDPTWDNNATYRESAKEFGYFITPGNEQYDSFPESIESIFYAYRITGDSKWQDYNWEIVQALEKESTSTIPSAPISDVNIPKSFISELPRYVAKLSYSDLLRTSINTIYVATILLRY
jgi:mannosyl-oligosaccharide alpha-1,2-mannosidase